MSAESTFRIVSSGAFLLAADDDSAAMFSGKTNMKNWAVFLDLFRRGFSKMESWSLIRAERDALS